MGKPRENMRGVRGVDGAGWGWGPMALTGIRREASSLQAPPLLAARSAERLPKGLLEAPRLRAGVVQPAVRAAEAQSGTAVGYGTMMRVAEGQQYVRSTRTGMHALGRRTGSAAPAQRKQQVHLGAPLRPLRMQAAATRSARAPPSKRVVCDPALYG